MTNEIDAARKAAPPRAVIVPAVPRIVIVRASLGVSSRRLVMKQSHRVQGSSRRRVMRRAAVRQATQVSGAMSLPRIGQREMPRRVRHNRRISSREMRVRRVKVVISARGMVVKVERTRVMSGATSAVRDVTTAPAMISRVATIGLPVRRGRAMANREMCRLAVKMSMT